MSNSDRKEKELKTETKEFLKKKNEEWKGGFHELKEKLKISKENSFDISVLCVSLLSTIFFYFLTFSVLFSILQSRTFYDSRCLLSNIIVDPNYSIRYNLIIFNFTINHNSQNFTAQRKRVCPKIDIFQNCDYPSDWFRCNINKESDGYFFEDFNEYGFLFHVFTVLCLFLTLFFGISTFFVFCFSMVHVITLKKPFK